MPYLTNINRTNEPIVLVNEDLSTIQGLNSVTVNGYTSGADGQTTDRDAPRTSSGYTGSVDTTGIQDLGVISDKYTGTTILQPATDPTYTNVVNDIPKGFGTDLDKGGYVSNYETPTFPTTTGGGGTGTLDSNDLVWTLPNGQGFPPVRTLLFSNNRRTYYYEDKDLKTKFQVIGKTLEQCSRVSNEVVGEFTGKYQFNSVNLFGKGYTLKSLEVKTKFPFDRLGNPVETEYTLWVDTFVRYFTDNVQSVTTNSDGTLTYHYSNGTTTVVSQTGGPVTSGTGGGGYSDGTNTTTNKPAAKSNNGLFLIGGILLILIASNSK